MTDPEGAITRKRQFAQIPDELVTDKRLSSNAVRLWARLDKYAGRGGEARPSRGVLAADLGMSEATVKRAFAELVGAGWISRVRRGRSNVWETQLNDKPRVTGDPSSTEARVTGDPSSGKARVTGDPP